MIVDVTGGVPGEIRDEYAVLRQVLRVAGTAITVLVLLLIA